MGEVLPMSPVRNVTYVSGRSQQECSSGLIYGEYPRFFRVPETGPRLRGRIESVLTFATSHKYRKGEKPARWTDNLKGLLPKHKRGSRAHDPPCPMTRCPSHGGAAQTPSRQRQVFRVRFVQESLDRTARAHEAAIDMAISRKPKGHDFIIDRRNNRPAITRHMSATGG
jgi:hypothetical protein